IPLDPNSGIFVTLNPADKGYGGRQKLPDNLKQLFRPVVMSQPDNDIIAEVILYCEGFKYAKSIGNKLVEVFDLSRKLLTKQQHYDWGLRALKTVLGGCGSVLKATRKNILKDKNSLSSLEEEGEKQLVVQALRLNTLSKLTFADCARFDSLVRDVFPGVPFTSSGYEELTSALKESFTELGLLYNENQNCENRYTRKCLEVYEQLQQRMGVVIVGPSGSGKTTLCNLLGAYLRQRGSLMKMGKTLKQYTINPKAMPRTQLLGQIDLDTRQWTDGVLTLSALQVYSEPPENLVDQYVHSWIVCDGDVDPEWIESLNSVLDDNRLLTLPSGWRIQFGPNVNFIFETHDLSYASTCNNITYGNDFPQQGEMIVGTSLVGVVENGLSQLHGVTSRAQFTVALLRGLGGNLTLPTREAFAKQLFSRLSIFSFAKLCNQARRDGLDTYTMDNENMDLELETSSSSLPLIMTADVKRTVDVIEPWLNIDTQQPFLLVGPQGCGKSLILKHCFSKLRSTEVAVIHCSAQITPQHVLQKLSQVCMVISSNTGRVYRPRNTDNLILYFKDINLARPDKWGTNPGRLLPLDIQVITYHGFYDNNLEWVGLEKVQIVASMTGGSAMGRHILSPRFTSITRIYSISYPQKDELKAIYGMYMSSILNFCVPKHPIWKSKTKVSSLADSLIKIYEEVKNCFTPMQQNHYLFTPRDLTHWCFGLLRYDLKEDEQSPKLVLEEFEEASSLD
ncbi:hypothetical protein L9F63_026474, partial [Diploptera punctata]